MVGADTQDAHLPILVHVNNKTRQRQRQTFIETMAAKKLDW